MEFETEHLLLRPWKDTDAFALHDLAKNPLIGEMAGWLPHSDPDDSLLIIQGIYSRFENYCIVSKDANRPVGNICVLGGKRATDPLPPDEYELGCWIGEPYWNNGYSQEAGLCLIKYLFEERNAQAVWLVCDDRNEKSKWTFEKFGFSYQYTKRDVYDDLYRMSRDYHFTRKTRDEYLKNENQ